MDKESTPRNTPQKAFRICIFSASQCIYIYTHVYIHMYIRICTRVLIYIYIYVHIVTAVDSIGDACIQAMVLFRKQPDGYGTEGVAKAGLSWLCCPNGCC